MRGEDEVVVAEIPADLALDAYVDAFHCITRR